MDLRKSTQIIGCLMMGYDPNTGESFPQDSVYNDPEIIRALVFAFNILKPKMDQEEKKEKKALLKPARQGKAWANEEDEKLTKLFSEGKSVNEIAALHERSLWAIEKRIEKLGLSSGDIK